jgi:hypothetical protein
MRKKDYLDSKKITGKDINPKYKYKLSELARTQFENLREVTLEEFFQMTDEECFRFITF